MRVAVAPSADPVAAARGATGASVVLVIEPGRDPLAQALALAAIGPLAVEAAPARRINAVAVAAGADPAAVAAAAAFLERAGSTTGQVIEVS